MALNRVIFSSKPYKVFDLRLSKLTSCLSHPMMFLTAWRRLISSCKFLPTFTLKAVNPRSKYFWHNSVIVSLEYPNHPERNLSQNKLRNKFGEVVCIALRRPHQLRNLRNVPTWVVYAGYPDFSNLSVLSSIPSFPLESKSIASSLVITSLI